MWLTRLSVRLVIMSTALIISAMMVFTYLAAEKNAKTISEEIKKQAIALADNLAASTATYIVVSDYTSLESILVRAAEFPSILDLQVLNDQGKVIGDVFRNEQGDVESRYGGTFKPPEGEAKRLIMLRENSMTIWQPVILGDLVGWVRTGYTLERVEQVRSQVWQYNILIGSFIAFFTTVFLYVYLRKPMMLIEKSTEFADTLNENAGEQLDVKDTYYEFNRLTNALNRTSRNLQAKNDALNQKIREQQQLTEQLEQRVSERTMELSVARDDAINANKSKSEFLAIMSHEIRTPLTAIIGFSESLLDSDQTVQERVDSIYRIIRAGKHLLRVINEILDLSKIEANKLEVEFIPISLVDVFRDIYSLVSLLAADKGLNFNIDCDIPMPETIQSDPVRFKQILINLCNNAIKFTKEGNVTIKVSCDSENENLIVKVIDTGIGLSREQVGKLFKPFSQADTSTTRKYGGTGLGLHLSKQLAEKLGGDLTVESVLDVGSSFILTINTGSLDNVLCVKKHPDFDKIYKEKQIVTGQVHLMGCVLLAEDNVDNQLLVSLYLRRLGLQIEIANNGKEALEKYEQVKPDLILMDIQMPIMDGLTASRKLRDLGYEGPIVALTANAMQEEQQEFINAGCNGVCTKPIDHADFIRELSKHLETMTPSSETNPPIVSSILADEPDMIDLVQQFVGKLPGMVEKVQTAYRENNLDGFKAEVHELKGVSGNFGYKEIFDINNRIEFEIITDNKIAIEYLLASLDEMVTRIQEGLDAETPTTGNVTPIAEITRERLIKL